MLLLSLYSVVSWSDPHEMEVRVCPTAILAYIIPS